jgi:hypothetical protein
MVKEVKVSPGSFPQAPRHASPPLRRARVHNLNSKPGAAKRQKLMKSDESAGSHQLMQKLATMRHRELPDAPGSSPKIMSPRHFQAPSGTGQSVTHRFPLYVTAIAAVARTYPELAEPAEVTRSIERPRYLHVLFGFCVTRPGALKP